MKNIKVDSGNADKWALLEDGKVVPFQSAPKDEIAYWCNVGDKRWTRYHKKKTDDEEPKREERTKSKGSKPVQKEVNQGQEVLCEVWSD